MPVYLISIHTYGSWQEDHKKGYVQRGEGLKRPSPRLAAWRDDAQKHPSVLLAAAAQAVAAEACRFGCHRSELRGHGLSTTPTHVHLVVSFAEPLCTCPLNRAHREAWESDCSRSCPAGARLHAFATWLKRHLGARLAIHHGTRGVPYLGRGWNVKKVRGYPHLRRLLTRYLPDHVHQRGAFYDEAWLRDGPSEESPA